MTANLTPRAEFEALFDTFTTSAWRLECQGAYDEPEERAPLRQFAETGEVDLAWFADWPDWVREVRASGREIGRVRVLTEPLSEYLRFELAITPPAVEAGEDIRLLPANRWAGLGLPREDFWIFDGGVVGALVFGESGVLGAEVHTDPAAVAVYRDRQRAAWDAALTYEEWINTC